MRALPGSACRTFLWTVAVVAMNGALSLGCDNKAEEGGVVAPFSTSPTYTVTLKTAVVGDYVVAEGGGGGAVNANRSVASTWETFTLYDLNGGTLDGGDQVALAAHNGQLVSAEQGGGGPLHANRNQVLDWETFTLVRVGGGGAIASGDRVQLQTKTKGLFVSALNGGGDTVVADRAVASGWETFIIDGVQSPPPPPPPSGVRVVAYLPNYSGSYADWARRIDFHKMTHLNLAFATANPGNGWDMGASDGDVRALVDAAHAAGVLVLASLGGGGGDQTVIARYRDPANIAPLVAKLDQFVSAHNFDGVDIDIEDSNNLGAAYSSFVNAVVNTLRPEHKLVTAAVAQYLQDSMSDSTLHQFDFLNVMIYSNFNDSVNAMNYYANNKGVPKGLLTLGAGFFGGDSSGNEYSYADILRADPAAWSKDQTSVNGRTVNYTGMASMQKLATYSKGFGGIMFWELSEDTTDSHSLYKVIQNTL
jgi:chitinase